MQKQYPVLYVRKFIIFFVKIIRRTRNKFDKLILFMSSSDTGEIIEEFLIMTNLLCHIDDTRLNLLIFIRRQ